MVIWTAIERFSGKKVEHHRKGVYKMVDTCAAEYKAQTPYFYSTYDEENEAEEFIKSENLTRRRSWYSVPVNPYRSGIRVRLLLGSLRMGTEETRL